MPKDKSKNNTDFNQNSLTSLYNPAGKDAKAATWSDPRKLDTSLIQDQRAAYKLSDQDWRSRLPLLAKGQQLELAQQTSPLEGKGDPYLQGILGQSGLGRFNLGQSETQQAINMGQQPIAKEDRDRTYWSRFINANKARPFGLNANNVGDIALSNAGNQNRMKIQQSENASAADLASVSQQAQQNMAYAGAIGSALHSGVSALMNSGNNTSGPNYYNTSAGGGQGGLASIGGSLGGDTSWHLGSATPADTAGGGTATTTW